MGKRHAKLRRSLVAMITLLACVLLVLLIVGDRLSTERIFTDGQDALGEETWGSAQRVIWRELGPLRRSASDAPAEGSPGFAAAGRDLFFAQRVKSAGWELMRTRWTPEGYAPPEPLFELNTARDEVDPCLVDGGRALLFASNRAGGRGGFDLFRAEHSADGFRPPVRLASLCSELDERHPTSDRLGTRLVFASNRLAVDGTRYDLYQSLLGPDGFSAPELIAELSGGEGVDTRSPALSPDGRFLLFASDRTPSKGGYDLFRALLFVGRWQAPQALDILNTDQDELDPAFSSEGTLLAFARTRPDGDALQTGLQLAERREIMVLERPGDGIMSWLLYALALALLALAITYLLLHWRDLHPFIKFLILSAIVHLLVLLFITSRRAELEFPGIGGERAVTVQFIPQTSQSPSRERRASTGDVVRVGRRDAAYDASSPSAAAPAAPAARRERLARALPRRESRQDETAAALAALSPPSRARADVRTTAGPRAHDPSQRKSAADPRQAESVAAASATGALRQASSVEAMRQALARSDSPSAAELEARPVPRRTASEVTPDRPGPRAVARARDAAATPEARPLRAQAGDVRKSGADRPVQGAVANASTLASSERRAAASGAQPPRTGRRARAPAAQAARVTLAGRTTKSIERQARALAGAAAQAARRAEAHAPRPAHEGAALDPAAVRRSPGAAQAGPEVASATQLATAARGDQRTSATRSATTTMGSPSLSAPEHATAAMGRRAAPDQVAPTQADVPGPAARTSRSAPSVAATATGARTARALPVGPVAPAGSGIAPSRAAAVAKGRAAARATRATRGATAATAGGTAADASPGGSSLAARSPAEPGSGERPAGARTGAIARASRQAPRPGPEPSGASARATRRRADDPGARPAISAARDMGGRAKHSATGHRARRGLSSAGNPTRSSGLPPLRIAARKAPAGSSTTQASASGSALARSSVQAPGSAVARARDQGLPLGPIGPRAPVVLPGGPAEARVLAGVPGAAAAGPSASRTRGSAPVAPGGTLSGSAFSLSSRTPGAARADTPHPGQGESGNLARGRGKHRAPSPTVVRGAGGEARRTGPPTPRPGSGSAVARARDVGAPRPESAGLAASRGRGRSPSSARESTPGEAASTLAPRSPLGTGPSRGVEDGSPATQRRRHRAPGIAAARARDGAAAVALGPPTPVAPGRGPAVARALVQARSQPSLALAGRSRVSTGAGYRGAPGIEPRPRDLLQPRNVLVGAAEPETPAIYAQRRGAARLEALQKAGGGVETEAAVLAGLRYLRSRQRPTGAWGRRTRDDKYGDVRIGKTGLALLAFLGSDHTHKRKGDFQATVSRGLGFILEAVDPRTGHIGDTSSYGHGIATYALAEAYALTRDAELRVPLQRVVKRILRAQVRRSDGRTDGGWGYFYRDPDRSYDRWPRLSVTVWQIMALESARIGGLAIPDDALPRAKEFVLRCHDWELGAFRYNHDPDWLDTAFPTLPGSNAAALFALELFGIDSGDQRYQTALEFVNSRRPDYAWRRTAVENFVRRGQGNEYFLYYATLALRLHAGKSWDRWNGALKRLLLPSQAQDGSWPVISHYREYARDTDRDRSYTTAMCVLMLEVYYRYDTPLLQAMARAIPTRKRLPEAKTAPVARIVVTEVDQGSVAESAGLRTGDVILAMAGRPVRTLEDLQARAQAMSGSTRLRILRGSTRRTLLLGGQLEGITVELREHQR